MSKKKKGFTLIELIAVIIIIAIIALILTPIIGSLIRAAKIRSAVVSAYGYVAATNNEIVAKSTKGINIAEDTYDVIENILGVKYEGKGPSDGYYNVLKNKVDEGEFCINGFDIRYENGKATYIKDGEVCPAPGTGDDKDNTPGEEMNKLCDGSIVYNDVNEYKVTTVEDLVCLSRIVSEGNNFQGKTIRLAKDIDFNDDKSYSNANKIYDTDINGNSQLESIKTEVTTEQGFLPIGNSSAKFNGTFDGQNHIISNLMINRLIKCVALFGQVYTSSVISNIRLDNPVITGNQDAGSLVGYNQGTISNISAYNVNITSGTTAGGIFGNHLGTIVGGNVTGTIVSTGSNAGGLAGYTQGGTSTGISINATVSAQKYSGGISGYFQYGSVKEVVVNGEISSTGQYVGGIAGYSGDSKNRATTISEVVVNANIKGSSYVGGIVGYLYRETFTISGVVEGGSVTATNGNAGKASGSNGYTGIIYTSSDIVVSRKNSSNYDGNEYESSYHSIGMYDDVLDTYYGGDSDGSGYYFDYKNNESDKLVLKKVEDHSFDITIKGSGTEENPYILESEKDFKDAALLLKGDYYFKINDNIDISTYRHFFNLGTAKNYFTGHIIGNNKTISKMYLNGGQYGGFVGYLNGGSIKDISIKESKVAGRYNTGSATGLFVGNSGTIELNNITIGKSQEVSGSDNVGGIVGILGTNSKVINISDIESIKVTGISNYSFTGGVIGYINSGASMGGFNLNNAVIKGVNYVGGVVGRNTGGAVYAMNIENIDVSGYSYIGGIVGFSSSTDTIKEIVVRGKVIGTGASIGGVLGGSNNYKDTIDGVLVNAEVTGLYGVAGVAVGGCTMYSIVEGGSITSTHATNGNAGKATIGSSYTGLIYTSSAAVVNRTLNGNDGNGYEASYHYIGMYDDVLDTYYGGDNDGSGYYFDFENDESDKIVLKKVEEHSFDITIKGEGTIDNPYILETEKDFKDASLLLKGDYYFKINDNIDVSTFRHFFNIGTAKNYFTGHIIGNNKTISKMNLNGGQYSGFVGYLNGGSIKDVTINNSNLRGSYGTGSINGVVIGNGNEVVGNNIVVNGVNVDCTIGSTWTGTVIGSISGNIDNVKVGTFEIKGGDGVGGLIGQLESESSISKASIDLAGKTIKGNGYVGGIAGKIAGVITFDSLVVDNIRVEATGRNAGGLFGYMESGSSIGGFNLNNAVVQGGEWFTGGVVGYNHGGTIYAMNIENVNVSGMYEVGGVVGRQDTGTINEIVVRGKVTGTGYYVGGVVGRNQTSSSGDIINGVLVNTEVTGIYFVGGMVGVGTANGYGVVEGGSVISTVERSAGKVSGDTYRGLIYASSSVVLSGSQGADGTSYSSEYNSDLSYYGSIKYNTTQPLLESSLTGDVNKSGWWFDYNSNGDIIVVRVDSGPIPPVPPSCDNCSNPDTHEQEKVGSGVGEGICETGDVTPPTCEFYYSVPVVNGIRASFSCTDDTEAPTIASLFNATTKEQYSYADILERGSTKNGVINGNTKNITSTWTTSYELNKPQRGLCYYYQYGAIDSCGNWSSYVTKNCYYGFSNPE